MARLRHQQANFATGLQTTRVVQADFPWHPVFQNARTSKGAAQRRLGMVRVARVTTGALACDFDGVNDHVSLPYDARVWALGVEWTVEMLANADTLAATSYLFAMAGATPGLTIHQTNGNNVVANVWDSAGANTTVTAGGASATTLIAVQFKRKGATLTLTVNNGTPVTGTMDATNLIRVAGVTAILVGCDQAAGNFYDGKVDFLRLFRVAKTGQADGWRRLVNPRAASVLADYPMDQDANGFILDRSAFENHGIQKNTVGTAASLAVNYAPVQMIASHLDRQAQRKVLIIANGQSYYGAL